jgi:hypothetical protein
MDVKCSVCGEPYGLPLDMQKWEVDLFKAGAGCPSCEGEPPNGKYFEPKSIFDLENGDGDPIERLIAYENAGKIAWEKPDPVVLWTCDGCGVQVVRSVEDGQLEYDLPSGAPGAKWYNSHPYHRGEAEEVPAHIFQGGQKVCEFCLCHCDHCNRKIAQTIEFSDVYDDGWSAPNEQDWHGEGLCVDCLESQCECGGWADDGTCDCSEEDSDDEEADNEAD